MTWTTPRTWADGDYPGGTTLNTHLRDQLLALYSPPQCEAHRVATLAVTSGTTVLVPLEDERFDQDWGAGSTGTFHSLVTNTSRIVIPYDGIYEFDVFWQWSGTPGVGNAIMNLRLNSAGSSSGGTSVRQIVHGSDRAGAYRLRRAVVAGDYVELFANQSSGGSLSVSGGAGVTGVYVRMVGA